MPQRFQFNKENLKNELGKSSEIREWNISAFILRHHRGKNTCQEQKTVNHTKNIREIYRFSDETHCCNM